MTWGEWKKWMEGHGVKDSDEIRLIEASVPQQATLLSDAHLDMPWSIGWVIR